MSLNRRGASQRDRDEHHILVFVVVAAVTLGTLFLAAQIAFGKESPALTEANGAPVNASAGGPPAPAVFAATAPAPNVDAESYAIIERSCGALLYGKNEHERLPPASLTKILTALVVEDQNARLDDMVESTVSAKQMARQGSSVMGLEPRMRISVIDLLYGLFLPSGNDAAITLAQYIGRGDVGRFVDLMNRESAKLDLRDSHFTNPHGLDDAGLYSSAYDMAVAGRALLDNPVLAEISSTPEYRGSWPGPLLQNGNRLLKSYPGAFGVKIGFTENAQQTIVAAAERDGRQLVVSVFGTDDRYTDTTALLDWAFASIPPACAVR